jgi:hypothetical protein
MKHALKSLNKNLSYFLNHNKKKLFLTRSLFTFTLPSPINIFLCFSFFIVVLGGGTLRHLENMYKIIQIHHT